MSEEKKFPNVYKKSKNSYRYVLTFTMEKGKTKVYEKRGFKTPEEAYNAMVIKRAELEKLKKDKKYFQSINYAIDEYIKHCKEAKKLKPTSIHTLELYLRRLFRIYGDLPMETFLRSKQLSLFRLRYLNVEQFSKITINKSIGYIKDLYKFASINKIITHEAYDYCLNTFTFVKFDSVTRQNKPPRKETNFWTRDQFIEFIDSIENPNYKTMFFLLGQLGLRVGEVRGLQFKQFDLKERVIHINQQALAGVGKGETIITVPKSFKSIRTIPLSNILYESIKDYIARNKMKDPEAFFFFNQRTPIGKSTINRILDKCISKTNLPKISIHGFRHSCITWLLELTLTPQEIGQVSTLFGHSSITITLDMYMKIHEKTSDKIVHFFDNENNFKKD